MIKGLYTYLEQIGFEKKVKEKAELMRKVSKSDNAFFSDFNVLQLYFSIIQELYIAIYNDIEEFNNAG